MPPSHDMRSVRETLGQVAGMLEEMRSHLSRLTEEQVLWVPPGEEVWPILRAVTHCVNCEHRAVVELNRALAGQPTPQTTAVDTGVFAWLGPTPYALARVVDELRGRVEALSEMLGESHLAVEAVRYPEHPSRALPEYVERMRHHTARHLEGMRKKMAVMPPQEGIEPEVQARYPGFGQGAESPEPRS